MTNQAIKITQPIEYYQAGQKQHGTGSICKRKDGRWMGTLYVGKDQATGKYIRKYVYGYTKREAQEKLIKAKADQGVQ